VAIRRLIILAGGFGTRLSSIINDLPKPLAPINGKPFLYYILEKWIENGITEFIFLLHHRAGQIIDFVEGEKEFGILKNCKTSFVIENTPMGTGGAIANAVSELNLTGSFIVTNADTWLSSGYEQMLDSPVNSIGITRVVNADRFGTINIVDNKIVSFEEKADLAEPGWINVGIYHLDSKIFLGREGSFSLEREIFPELIETNKITAVIVDTEFIDIGIPEDYRRFCDWIEAGRAFKL